MRSTGANERAFRAVTRMLLCTLLALSGVRLASGQEGSGLKQRIQRNSKVVETDGTALSQMRTAPGQLVAEGQNETPTGPYQLKRYRIEELQYRCL